MATTSATLEYLVPALDALAALEKVGKVVQFLSSSWQVLQEMDKSRKELAKNRLRDHLRLIGNVLRDAQHLIRDKKLLHEDDFVVVELEKVLRTLNKACSDPHMSALEVVMDRAICLQKYMAEKLKRMADGPLLGIAYLEPELEDNPLHRLVAKLKANTLLLTPSLAIAESMSGCMRTNGTDHLRYCQPLGRTSSADSAKSYDTVVSSDCGIDRTGLDAERIDCVRLISNDEDDGYDTCDEEDFWASREALRRNGQEEMMCKRT